MDCRTGRRAEGVAIVGLRDCGDESLIEVAEVLLLAVLLAVLLFAAVWLITRAILEVLAW